MALPDKPQNNYIVGKMVAVLVNIGTTTVPLYCTDGNTSRKVNMIKVSNSESNGFQEQAVGSKGATATINLVYNASAPVTLNEGDPCVLVIDTMGKGKELGIIPGTGSTLKGRLLEIPGWVESVGDKWNAETDYTWSISFTSSGAYKIFDSSGDATVITAGAGVVTEPTGS